MPSPLVLLEIWAPSLMESLERSEVVKLMRKMLVGE